MAGVTGYKVEEEQVTDPGTNTRFPIIKAVQGWGMLMRQDATSNVCDYVPHVNTDIDELD